MTLQGSLPIVSTSVLSLLAAGHANASARNCYDMQIHAQKLTKQAERYQQRAYQLKPGEHDHYIRALKERANNMRAKAIALQQACGIHNAPPHYHYHHHAQVHY